VVSRLIGGLSKASVSIAIAIVSDVCPPSKRGSGMALVGVAFSVAFIVGPVVGAYFAATARLNNSSGWNPAPAKFAISMTLLELALTILLLPETHSSKSSLSYITSFTQWLSSSRSSIVDYVSPRALLRFNALSPPETSDRKSDVSDSLGKENIARLRRLGLIYLFYLFLYSALEFTLSFLTHLRFEFTSMQQGQMYLFSGMLMMAIQGGYVRRIPARQQRQGAMMGLACIIPSYLLVSVAYTPSLLYLALALYAVASAMVVPCLTTMVLAECGDTRRGTCLGIFRSIGALARALGPIFGSSMFWLMGPCACYVTGALLLTVPLIMLRNAAVPNDASVNGVDKKAVS